MKAARAVVFLLFLLTGLSVAAAAPWAVSPRAPEVFQGGIAVIRVSGEDRESLQGFFRNHEIVFFTEPSSHVAFFGADLDEKPGPISIHLKGLGKSGEKRAMHITLRVKEKMFTQEHISVPAAFDRMNEATRQRIKLEQEQLDRLWAISGSRRLWEGRFLAPVSGEVTSPFGLRRIVNGSPRSPHGGVDLKASAGTEVLAPNHGQVVLRDEFFFSGKSMVLDHGGGLFTMYFHLADFTAGMGSMVRKGDLIGRAGMTGRVTGPHLHWGARLNGARVDPFELIEATGDGSTALSGSPPKGRQ